jgi:hypothetical protein
MYANARWEFLWQVVTWWGWGGWKYKSVTVDIWVQAVYDISFTIVDADCTSLSVIVAQPAAVDTDDNSADEIQTSMIQCTTWEATNWSFVLSLFASEWPISWKIKVFYTIK